MAPVTSPCLQLCAIDPHSGLCRGCGRTIHEIAAWSTMPEPERRAVMACLPARIGAVTSVAGRQLPS